MARKKACACDAHKHSLGKTDLNIKAPAGKDVTRLFAAASGFTGGRLLRHRAMDKVEWFKENPFAYGLLSGTAGVLGFANMQNDTARYASLGVGIDGLDAIYSTIKALKDNPNMAGIGTIVKRHILGTGKSSTNKIKPSKRIVPGEPARQTQAAPRARTVQHEQPQVLVLG